MTGENAGQYIESESDLVPEGSGCPQCGERRRSWLVQWEQHAGHTSCWRCGYSYVMPGDAHDRLTDAEVGP